MSHDTETKIADKIWLEIQEAISYLRSHDEELGKHLAEHIVREGNSFRYTGKLKWQTSLPIMFRPEDN